MKSVFKKIYRLTKLSFLSLLAVVTLFSCQIKKVAKTETINETTIKEQSSSTANVSIDENGTYTSKDDVALTEQVQEGAKLLDLCLMDHLIIGDQTYYSFKERGLIQ